MLCGGVDGNPAVAKAAPRSGGNILELIAGMGRVTKRPKLAAPNRSLVSVSKVITRESSGDSAGTSGTITQAEVVTLSDSDLE